MNNTSNQTTVSFISIFCHVDDKGNQFLSGLFTGANGERLTAFSFANLMDLGVELRHGTDKNGRVYAYTSRPVTVEYRPYGDSFADIVKCDARKNNDPRLLSAVLACIKAGEADAAKAAPMTKLDTGLPV